MVEGERRGKRRTRGWAVGAVGRTSCSSSSRTRQEFDRIQDEDEEVVVLVSSAVSGVVLDRQTRETMRSGKSPPEIFSRFGEALRREQKPKRPRNIERLIRSEEDEAEEENLDVW